MTIQKINIKNYQSHHDTELPLGNFTVIVGPSNTGKSALTRAIKALASNQSGKDFITHGQATAQISATTDKGTVVLTKGKPEDSYVLLHNDDTDNPKRFTKLGGSVPEEVTDFLGIAPKDAINFAGQFDMPYLLRTSAAEVARTLGELTNVSSIFEASREALRRKSSYASTLKTREADLAAIEPRLQQFENLDEQMQAVTVAEAHLVAAQNLTTKKERLNDLLMTLSTATSRLKTAREATDAPLPDVAPLVDLYARRERLNALLTTLATSKGEAKRAGDEVFSQSTIVESLDEEYNEALHEAGTCPTCGQNTEGVHTHA